MAAANATIGALHVKLGLDSAQFQTGLKAAQGKLGAFGKLAGLSLAGVGVAAAGAGVALGLAAKRAIDAADEIGKTAQKIGVGVEALSGLKYAAELSDVSFEQLSNGLKKLGVNMAGAADGTGPAAGAFKQLGISVRDSNGNLRDTDAVFADVATAFSGMKDGALKTALAVAIFGKAGADLIPLLNEGAGGLAQMRKEAADLGIVISDETAAASEAFNDNLTRLKKVGAGVTTQLAAGMAPALASVTGAMVDLAKDTKFMSGVGQVLDATLRGLATGGVLVGAVFVGLGDVIRRVVAAILQVRQGKFADAFDTLKAGVDFQVKNIAAASGAITKIWSKTAVQTQAAKPKVADGVAGGVEGGAKRVKAARETIESEADKARKAFADFIADSEKDLANRGKTGDQVKADEARAKASDALTRGFNAEAAALLRVADAYEHANDNAAVAVDKTQTFGRAVDDLNEATKDLAQTTSSKIEDATRDFDDMASAVDQVFRGISNNDWVGALNGIVRAVTQLKTAFEAGATALQKFTAVGGAIAGVGGMVGGTAGGVLTGIGSGAAAGAALGSIVPGIGTVVGGVVGGILGGIGGLFGASKAKKRAKREAAERARLEAERKAAEEAATKRELEIRLMELAGDAAGAQAAREADLLKTLSPANAELQKQVWAQEQAAAIVAQRTALERDLLDASGDASASLKALRDDALKALPESLRGLQQAIFDVIDATSAVDAARSALADAADREIGALEDVRDRFADLGGSLRDFLGDLKDAAGGLDPRRALGSARAALDQLAPLIKIGNAEALAALPKVGKNLVDLSARFAPTAQAFAADRAKVAALVGAGVKVADATASNAQAQIDAIRASVDGQLGLGKTMLSVKAALDNLRGAIEAQTAAAAFAAEAQALARSLGAATAVPAVTLPSGGSQVADDLARALEPYLAGLVINTRATADHLDDVINGGLSITTTVAA